MTGSLKIIVVDDDADDKQLMHHAFAEARVVNPVVYLDGGEQLFEFLNTTQPKDIGIILTDLNMPGMDGREMLRLLKLNTQWKETPVIIFSTSDSIDDIRRTYSLGAASYIAKPLTFNQLVSILRIISAYWFENVLLPV